MRDFLKTMLPCLFAIVAVYAFLAAGGWQTPTGRLVAAGVMCLGVAALAAVPFVIQRARRQAREAEEALKRDLDRRHQERQAMSGAEGS
jgi:membrane protein implicated in regulation of membrane protease activity